MRRRNAEYARAGWTQRQESASRQNRDVPQRACRQEFARIRGCVNVARAPLAYTRVHRFARVPLCHPGIYLSLDTVAPRCTAYANQWRTCGGTSPRHKNTGDQTASIINCASQNNFVIAFRKLGPVLARDISLALANYCIIINAYGNSWSAINTNFFLPLITTLIDKVSFLTGEFLLNFHFAGSVCFFLFK